MVQCEFNFNGPQLRDAGMRLATEHADEVLPKWSELAYDFVVQKFLPGHETFMAEDIRSFAAISDFPLPPSARAWGSIMVKLVNNSFIKKIGIKQVSNPKAHCANANYYQRA